MTYRPLAFAPGPLFIGLDFWHHPAVAVATVSSMGQLRYHYAERMDGADIGILVRERLKPYLAKYGLLERQRIYSGDPTGDDGDQSDKEKTAVKRLLALLPGEWRKATNDIDKLQGVVNEQLGRKLSTGEPAILLGKDAQELDSAWSGGWFLNEHGKPVQHGEQGQHSHVGMAGAYLVWCVFGDSKVKFDAKRWALQDAYVQPWGGSQTPSPSPAIAAAARTGSELWPGFNREAWAEQYKETKRR